MIGLIFTRLSRVCTENWDSISFCFNDSCLVDSVFVLSIRTSVMISSQLLNLFFIMSRSAHFFYTDVFILTVSYMYLDPHAKYCYVTHRIHGSEWFTWDMWLRRAFTNETTRRDKNNFTRQTVVGSSERRRDQSWDLRDPRRTHDLSAHSFLNVIMWQDSSRWKSYTTYSLSEVFFFFSYVTFSSDVLRLTDWRVALWRLLSSLCFFDLTLSI